MSIELLAASLRREAETEAASILERARAEAERVTTTSRDARRHETDAALASLQAAWRRDDERQIAAARRSAAARVLAARQGFLDRLFDAVAEAFAGIVDAPSFHHALPSHIDEALHFAGDRPVTVRCPTPLRDLVRDAVQDRAGVGVEGVPDLPAGVVVTTDDGALTIDNTLAARLERMRADLAIEVLAILEEGP